MTEDEIRSVIAHAVGYTDIRRINSGAFGGLQCKLAGEFRIVPSYNRDLNALAAARDQLINTPELRIRWVNTLRDVVGRTCTRRNKLGKPLVSDIDLLFATPEQLAETLVLTLKLKPVTEL